ncbi:hypothetical protein [Draconibacterium sediminis]|uniref:Uncharacterized protein n=1 Tax=Draconibacterium sediminis TaxID=1544798 RepID=A0A0D8JC69_9BACT|nr:hypothetical protein [Draconibacterium sediminis]KJF44309.1 hypothetical protein LH29_02010 [Draconibacterium sediminis]
MEKQIFYFGKTTKWDRITIFLYLILSIGLTVYYRNNPLNYKLHRDILFAYAFGTHFFLYLFNYKSLRNLKVYFVWFAFGLIQLFIYFKLKDIDYLQNVKGHASTGLRNTVPLLILFQILRFISAKTQGQELVAPGKGSTTDLFDERRITIIDFIAFAIYMAAMILLFFYD